MAPYRPLSCDSESISNLETHHNQAQDVRSILHRTNVNGTPQVVKVEGPEDIDTVKDVESSSQVINLGPSFRSSGTLQKPSKSTKHSVFGAYYSVLRIIDLEQERPVRISNF